MTSPMYATLARLKQSVSWRHVLVDAAVVLIAVAGGLGATWYGYSLESSALEVQRKDQLSAISQAIIDGFSLDLVRNVEAVRATGLMVAYHRSLERQEFTTFAESMMANVSSVSAMYWAPRITRDELPAFEVAASKELGHSFQVKEINRAAIGEAGVPAEYFPDLYCVPANAAREGVDNGAIAGRLAVMQLSRETREPIATGVSLSSIRNGENIFGIVMAVFSHDTEHKQAHVKGDSQEHLLGYVTASVSLNTLFREAAFRADSQHLDMLVFDQSEDQPALIFSALERPGLPLAHNGENPPDTAQDIHLAVDVAGRPWDVVLTPRTGYWSAQKNRTKDFVLGGGGSATVLLALFIFSLQRSRRQLERTRDKEARLGVILRATEAGTWEWNLRSGEVRIDDRWAAILGYTLDDLGPVTVELWQKLTHPQDLSAANITMEQHFAGITPTYGAELRMRHKLGHWVWVLARGALISRDAEGKPEWMAGTHIDISEEKELSQQMVDIRTALDAHAVVVITDPEGVITFANDKFCEISGYSRAEVYGKTHCTVKSGHHPPEYFANMWGTISSGKTWKGEICNRAKNGRLYWVDTTIAPILSADGKPAQYIAIRYDITASKHHEDELMRARVAAESASHAKSDFLATMSHEIRTPMNGILGMLRLLAHTSLTPRQQDYLGKAQTATKGLLAIINDILDFSKVEAGKLELEVNPFIIGDLLRDLSFVLSANLGNKPVEVLFDLDGGVPPVLIGDALRLRQILLNLAGNAIKFTEAGEVILTIAVNEIQKNERDQITKVELQFDVRDSGIGIPADKLGEIFKGFSQAESSTSRRFGGTGLGLSISKRLVALMGGNLQVESTVGEGSRFFFAASFDVPATSTPALLPPTMEDRPIRALIVDDNKMALCVHQKIVESMGWQSECVNSGEAALERLSQRDAKPVHIILVDWHMQGLDGWETIRRIREHIRAHADDLAETAPIVIMISNSGQEMLAQMPQQEIDMLDGYLVKPITASLLYDTVMDARADHAGQTGLLRKVTDSQRLAGLNLLVVEDNLLNQQIAQELLTHNGANVQIATGGIEGVAMALDADPPFSAILMDMQMPDIDGLEATRRIRSHSSMRAIPIIAMTANAMEGDKESCRLAGMVDHVSKPVDLEQLIATVLRHCQKNDSATSANGQSAVQYLEGMTPEPSSNIELIDKQAAVTRIGGDEVFYQRIVEAFRKEAPQLMDAAKAYILANEYQNAVLPIHTLKGLASTVGAMSLAELAADAEFAIKPEPDNLHAEVLVPLVGKLDALLAQVLFALNAGESVGSMPTNTPMVMPLADCVELSRSLSSLTRLLEANDMAATALITQIVSQYGEAVGSELTTLESAIAQLDFDLALTYCKNLLQNQLKAL